MKLSRFLLRYYPPGIILEYEFRDKSKKAKEIDILELNEFTDLGSLANRIADDEHLNSIGKRNQLRTILTKLREKTIDREYREFKLFKELGSHKFPLTDCAFNKPGDKFVTASHDRTARLFDTFTGSELLTLDGHRNVVIALAFNNPFGDRIMTGSFDKTAKIWSSTTGECLHTYSGHETEITCLDFDTTGRIAATGSMDCTARIWDVESGQSIHTLIGHRGR